MDPMLASIGDAIRRLRKARRLTQRALGDAIDLDPNLLGRIERGIQNPTLLTLARIAAGLNTHVQELVANCPQPHLSTLDRSS